VTCGVQGDRMWQFAVGLYLVKMDDNELRLAAVFGFTCGGLILLLGSLIGGWVDHNRRLKGILLFTSLLHLLLYTVFRKLNS